MRWLVLFVAGIRLYAAEPANLKGLDALIEQSRKTWNVPGLSVAVVKNDQVVYLKGFGVKELGKTDAVTPDTRFAIGSTTKAFTTAALAILVDDGKMQWDDPVRRHVPFFHLSDPLADTNVTMRDIVCHRTGLNRNDLLWFNSPWTREEIIRKIGLVKLSKPFRSAYQYQNIMFLTAGFAVGRIAGGSWEDFVRARILEPLGMTNTDFSTVDVVRAADYSAPHQGLGKDVKVIPWRNIDNIGPAGSINSSARDLAKWVRMQLNEGEFEGRRIVSKKNLEETHTPQMVIRMDDDSRSLNDETFQTSYGLGWVIQDYRGKLMVSHGGAIDGFRAQITLLPKEKTGIVVLTNLGQINMAEALRMRITDSVLGLGPIEWDAKYQKAQQTASDRQKKRVEEREKAHRKDTKPSRELEAYVGVYEEPAYGRAEVALAGGKLELKWSNWRSTLEHWHFDTFQAKGEDRLEGDVTFQLGADGNLRSLRMLDQEFMRVATEKTVSK